MIAKNIGKMDSPIEETELDVGSASDEVDSVETRRAHRPAPKPFTIESLIGNRGQVIDADKARTIDSDKFISGNGDDTEREREFLYQQHCLATATSALPGSYVIVEKKKKINDDHFAILPIG